jgi:hypothetical protein
MSQYYELNLPPATPRFRITKEGRKVFNKGYAQFKQGKTYEEVYGPERAADIKARISAKLMGNKFSPDRRPSRLIPVVQITPDGEVRHYETLGYAAAAVGICTNSIKWRIKHNTVADGRWFYESDYELWQRYLHTLRARLAQSNHNQTDNIKD